MSDTDNEGNTGNSKHARLNSRAKLRRYFTERLDKFEKMTEVHVSSERAMAIRDGVKVLFTNVSDEETSIMKPTIVEIEE